MNQINLIYFKLISQHRFMCLYDQFSLNHVNLILLISKVVFFFVEVGAYSSGVGMDIEQTEVTPPEEDMNKENSNSAQAYVCT